MSIRVFFALVVLAAFTVAFLHAQPSPPLVFEAATVKSNTSGARARVLTYPPARFVATNMPLRFVIANAFGDAASLPQYMVTGGARWLDTETFDIEGKAPARPEGAPPWRVDELKLMLRALLADRFGLRTHTEPREMDVYLLVTARRDGRLGSQLRRATGADCAPIGSPLSNGTLPACGAGPMDQGVLRGYSMTPDAIAQTLTAYVERPVINRTLLKGAFSFDLTFTLELARQGPPEPVADTGTSIVTALPEQLGLRLQGARAPVDVLVIDHVEAPSAN